MQEPNENKDELDAELLKKFQILRAMADDYIKLHMVGFSDIDTLMDDLDKLRAIDSMGVEWKVGYVVEEWYKLEGGEWVADFPPFPRHLLTDPDEYEPNSGEVMSTMWKAKARKSRLEGDK